MVHKGQSQERGGAGTDLTDAQSRLWFREFPARLPFFQWDVAALKQVPESLTDLFLLAMPCLLLKKKKTKKQCMVFIKLYSQSTKLNSQTIY